VFHIFQNKRRGSPSANSPSLEQEVTLKIQQRNVHVNYTRISIDTSIRIRERCRFNQNCCDMSWIEISSRDTRARTRRLDALKIYARHEISFLVLFLFLAHFTEMTRCLRDLNLASRKVTPLHHVNPARFAVEFSGRSVPCEPFCTFVEDDSRNQAECAFW